MPTRTTTIVQSSIKTTTPKTTTKTTRVQSSRKTTTPKTTTKTTRPKTTPKTTRVQSSRKTTSISRGGKTKGGANSENKIKILLLNDIEYQKLSEIITKQLLELMMNINDKDKMMVYTHLTTNKENNCVIKDNEIIKIDPELKIIIDIDCKFENSFSKKLVMQENNENEESNIEINLTHNEINILQLLYEKEKKLTKNKIDLLFKKINQIKTDYDTCLSANTVANENASACNKDQMLTDMMSNLAIEMINKRREQALTTKLNTHNGGKKQKVNKC